MNILHAIFAYCLHYHCHSISFFQNKCRSRRMHMPKSNQTKLSTPNKNNTNSNHIHLSLSCFRMCNGRRSDDDIQPACIECADFRVCMLKKRSVVVISRDAHYLLCKYLSHLGTTNPKSTVCIAVIKKLMYVYVNAVLHLTQLLVCWCMCKSVLMPEVNCVCVEGFHPFIFRAFFAHIYTRCCSTAISIAFGQYARVELVQCSQFD